MRLLDPVTVEEHLAVALPAAARILAFERYQNEIAREVAEIGPEVARKQHGEGPELQQVLRRGITRTRQDASKFSQATLEFCQDAREAGVLDAMAATAAEGVRRSGPFVLDFRATPSLSPLAAFVTRRGLSAPLLESHWTQMRRGREVRVHYESDSVVFSRDGKEQRLVVDAPAIRTLDPKAFVEAGFHAVSLTEQQSLTFYGRVVRELKEVLETWAEQERRATSGEAARPEDLPNFWELLFLVVLIVTIATGVLCSAHLIEENACKVIEPITGFLLLALGAKAFWPPPLET
jgi:hypothetical protein